ncbi:glutathione S-transferase family protein [Enterovirga sp. CN4-39]|uniref:glutathione S-transferase family protein n=1 Tax=Enterovirga sp. CN4-39 TaxID=3400910 RepID=UPI003BFB5646
MPTLVIANKCYSSWSLRPWLLLKQLGIAFDEILIPLGQPDTSDRIREHSPAGRVPILKDGSVAVWDSLSIMEYAAERWPQAQVWPESREARALARSISAEMHSGFQALRNGCPMNLGKRFGPKDRGEAVSRDVARIDALWQDARARFGQGGPFLFGAFSAADAMYAPVVTRFETYSVKVSPVSHAYMSAILGLPAFGEWRAAALQEPWFYKEDEVDEEPVANFRLVR